MKVRDVMQGNVVVIGEDETLARAQHLMRWSDIRHLPVLRPADGRLVGLLSERDLLRALAGPAADRDLLGALVREFMVTPVEHIHPDAELADAAADMVTKKLGCLPVIQLGELVGILSVGDVMSVLAQVPVPRAAEPTSAAELPVAAVMYPEPIAVRENEPFLATARRMAKLRVRHACVVDDIGRVKGIISERDVRRILGSPRLVLDPRYVPEAARNLRAEQVMKPAHTVNQSVPLREAAWLLLHARVGALPVIDEHGRLRGIVSYVDMLKQLLNEG